MRISFPLRAALLIILFVTNVIVVKGQNRATGFFLGPNLSYHLSTSNGTSRTSQIRTGYLLGLFSEFSISNRLHFQPALQITSKGKVEQSSSGKLTIITNYLEMPLVINYRPARFENKIIFGVGPTISIGIAAKRKDASTNNVQNLVFGKNLGQLAQVEYSICGVIGIQLTNDFSFSFVSSRGISNVYNSDSFSGGIKSISFGGKFAYRILRY